MKLSPQAITTIEMWRLGFVATVGTDGRPNVSPKGTFVVLDPETIAFGEIRSPQTITNLTANPETEINFVDQFTRKGVRVRGQAQMVPRGTAEFDGLIPHWQAGWGALADRVNIIVRIPVDQARPLVTPPYDDGATEEDMIAAWKQKCAGFYPGA